MIKTKELIETLETTYSSRIDIENDAKEIILDAIKKLKELENGTYQKDTVVTTIEFLDYEFKLKKLEDNSKNEILINGKTFNIEENDNGDILIISSDKDENGYQKIVKKITV